MQQHLKFSGKLEVDWHIDERTKTIGRMGIAAARVTLASCQQPESEHPLANAA